jgi:hypothetical protein
MFVRNRPIVQSIEMIRFEVEIFQRQARMYVFLPVGRGKRRQNSTVTRQPVLVKTESSYRAGSSRREEFLPEAEIAKAQAWYAKTFGGKASGWNLTLGAHVCPGLRSR